MLESTFELIGMAASNPHMIFCIFNLIVALLIVGSSKSNGENRELISTTTINDEDGNRNSASSPDKADEGVKDEGNDDEDLKRRVEEFIQKMNEGWKEENVKTYLFEQWHDLPRILRFNGLNYRKKK